MTTNQLSYQAQAQAQAQPQPQPQPQPQMSAQKDDVTIWIDELKSTAENPSSITTNPPPGAQPWYASFFGCFDPIDTCLITCCCPCVTFGKTHHRLHHSATLQDYSPVNTTCVGFCLTSYCCGNVVMAVLQRAGIKRRYGLQGSFVGDIARAICCGCCAVIQQDKEVEYHLLQQGGVVDRQPSARAEDMKVPSVEHE